MVLYDYRVRDAIDHLKQCVERLRQKFQANAPAAELLHEVATLKTLHENLEQILPAGVKGVGNFARHIAWIEKNIKRDALACSEGDFKDLCEHDIPEIEAAFKKWCQDPQHFDRELDEGVTNLLMRQENDSAVRKAFVILKERLVKRFGGNKDSDGLDLVNQIFGSKGSLAGKVDDSTLQAYRNLLAGLYGISRNKFAHQNVTTPRYEAEGLIGMINFLLKDLAKLS